MEREIKDLCLDGGDRTRMLTCKSRIDEEMIYYDFSKTHLTENIVDGYVRRMEGIERKIEGMFSGERINFTEDRKVLHVALRNKDVLDKVEGKRDVELSGDHRTVYEELVRMRVFVEEFGAGRMCGASGKELNTVVNIGIGGSDLGPRMVCDALSQYGRKGTEVHFVSNIDATEMIRVFERIDPESTLFVVVSKTFTTLETMKNAELAVRFLRDRLGKEESDIRNKHFIAVSSNVSEVRRHGISRVFAMWDFVGGRFSLWSAVGISIALYVGFENFVCLLRGASVVDEDFRRKRGRENMEMLHAIAEIFYSERNYNNKCLVSYDQYMEKFYLYLQQAEMESNGKPSREGETGMIVWGGVGTNTQHSFFQLLHQGTRKILTEFVMPLTPLHSEHEYHRMVVSNCLAQSRALMVGRESSRREEAFSGNRPSITICYSRLCPKTLGAMIAHYEHKIFVQGVYWGINSFDQFGVTLGKKIATELLGALECGKRDGYDESTNAMLGLLADRR